MAQSCSIADLRVWILAAQNVRLPEAVEVMRKRPGRDQAQPVLLRDVVEFDCRHCFLTTKHTNHTKRGDEGAGLGC